MLIFLSIVIGLLINGYFSYNFYCAAADKGYDSAKYFLLPFFFGLIGMVLVAALPNNNYYRNQTPTSWNKSNSILSGTSTSTNSSVIMPDPDKNNIPENHKRKSPFADDNLFPKV